MNWLRGCSWLALALWLLLVRLGPWQDQALAREAFNGLFALLLLVYAARARSVPADKPSASAGDT